MLRLSLLAQVAAVSSALIMTTGIGGARADEIPGWYAGAMGGLNLTDRSAGTGALVPCLLRLEFVGRNL